MSASVCVQDTRSLEGGGVRWEIVTDADGNTKMQPLAAPSPDANPEDVLGQLHMGRRPVRVSNCTLL